LDKGNITGCSELVQQSIQNLGMDVTKYSKEIIICSKYIQLCKLVGDINDSKDLIRSCVLSRILSGITDIRPKHKIICVRIAINKNMEAKNYRLVRKLINGIMNLNIKDKDQMNLKLTHCEENNNKNCIKNAFLMNCPRCDSTIDFSRDECIKCDNLILFCFATCLPISDSSYFQCSVCNQYYSQAAVTSSNDAKCQCCNLGVLESRKLKKVTKNKSSKKSSEDKSKSKNENKIPKSKSTDKVDNSTTSPPPPSEKPEISLNEVKAYFENMPKWKGYLSVASNAKKEYTKYFKKADKKQDAIIDGEEAKSFF